MNDSNEGISTLSAGVNMTTGVGGSDWVRGVTMAVTGATPVKRARSISGPKVERWG